MPIPRITPDQIIINDEETLRRSIAWEEERTRFQLTSGQQVEAQKLEPSLTEAKAATAYQQLLKEERQGVQQIATQRIQNITRLIHSSTNSEMPPMETERTKAAKAFFATTKPL